MSLTPISADCQACDYTVAPSYTWSRCDALPCPTTPSVTQEQQRIWGQVRAAASSYLQAKAALTAGSDLTLQNSNTNWNQRSDRWVAHVQTAVQPTRGNSLRSTLTSGKPGAGAPGGSGVDVKHDSYARFLNKRKAAVLRQGVAAPPTGVVATYGNKTYAVGLVAGSQLCCPAGL